MDFNNTFENSIPTDYFLIRKYLWSSSFYLHRYGSVIWIIAGLILNPLAFIIWTRPKLRRHNTSANYLAGIALSDFFFWILYTMHYLKMSWNINLQNAPVWCEMFQGLFLSIQYFSVPLVLIFSIERYIAVCHPFKREALCTHKRALINTIVCGISVLVLGFIQVIALTYNYKTGECDMRGAIIQNQVWNLFTTAIEVLISALLPFATLIVNILVIIELKVITNKTKLIKPSAATFTASSENASEHLLPEKRNSYVAEKAQDDKQLQKQQNKEKNAFKSSTILLLSVSFLLIITTLPVGLVYALQFICPNGNETFSLEEMKADKTWSQFATYQAVKEFVDFVAMIHFVINFVIYYATGDNFRMEFHILFNCFGNINMSDSNSISNSHKSPKKMANKRVNNTYLLRKNISSTATSDV